MEKTEQLEKSQNEDGKEESHDEELDTLLDEALEDFDKLHPKVAANPPPKPVQPAVNAAMPDLPLGSEELRQFEAAFEQLKEDFPELKESIDELVKVAEKDSSATDDHVQQSFNESLSKTIENLMKSTEFLNGEVFSEEELLKSMNYLGVDDEEAEFLPLVQDMVQQLLSKEVLYPSLKDVSGRYPAWIEAHRSELSPQELERYEKQCRIILQLCTLYESEEGAEAKEGQEARLKHTMELVQEMQLCGQPPKDLVGDKMDLQMPTPEMMESGKCALM